MSWQGEQGKVLEEALFDRLWEETTARIRGLKVGWVLCVMRVGRMVVVGLWGW